MKFVCEAGQSRTWFRIETEAEAEAEAKLMRHAVDRHFKREQDRARASYRPGPGLERDVGLKSHIAKAMPLFLTLRADDGAGLASAMLPPGGRDDGGFRIIIVGQENSDPYTNYAGAIRALGAHIGFELDRDRCYPYAQR